MKVKTKRRLKLASLTLAGLILVSIGVGFGIDFALKSELDNAKTEARAAGFTFTDEDLDAIVPHVTKEENSGRDILEFVGWATKKDNPPELKYRQPINIKSDDWRAYEKHLARLNLVQLDMEKIIRGKAPYFNTDWKEGFSRYTMMEIHTKPALSFVSMKAALLGHHGERKEALKIIKLILSASNHFGTQPYIDSMVARHMYINMAFSLVSRMDWSKPLSQEEQMLMIQIQSSCKEPPSFDYYLKFELAKAHIEFENSTIARTTARLRKDKGFEAVATERLLNSQFGVHVHARHLFLSAEALRIAQKSKSNPMQFLSEIKAFERNPRHNGLTVDGWISILYFPPLEISSKSYLKLLAKQRILSSCLRDQPGIDPFTGEPFRTKNTASTRTIYSFGPDGIDNNLDPDSDDFSITLPKQSRLSE